MIEIPPKETEWTLNSLHNHLAMLIKEKDKQHTDQINSLKLLIETKFEAQREAIIKAEVATQNHFDGINELQGTMKNQQDTYIPRKEVDIRVDGINERIVEAVKGLSASLSKVERDIDIIKATGGGMRQMWVIVSWVVMALIAVSARFWK